jgi:hypothetical protein
MADENLVAGDRVEGRASRRDITAERGKVKGRRGRCIAVLLRPATTWSQPDGPAQEPWTRTIVGRPAASTGLAVTVAGSIDNRSSADAAMATAARDDRVCAGRAVSALAWMDCVFIVSPSPSWFDAGARHRRVDQRTPTRRLLSSERLWSR